MDDILCSLPRLSSPWHCCRAGPLVYSQPVKEESQWPKHQSDAQATGFLYITHMDMLGRSVCSLWLRLAG